MKESDQFEEFTLYSSEREALSEEEHKKLKDDFEKLRDENREKYPELINYIDKIILECNPLEILAYYGFFEQIKPMPMGDEEIIEPNFAHIEFLQALFLKNKIEAYKRRSIAINHYQELKLNIEELFKMTSQMSSDNENFLIQEQTKNIRNPGTFSQTETYLLEFLHYIDEPFKSVHNISATAFIELIRELTLIQNTRINIFFTSLRKCVQEQDLTKKIITYHQHFLNQDPPQSEINKLLLQFEELNFQSQDADKFFLGHQSQYLWRYYSITEKDLDNLINKGKITGIQTYDKANLITFLNHASLEFGDLEKANTDHFFLGNPTWEKPLIKLERNLWFSTTISLLPSRLLNLLEENYLKDDKLRKSFEKSKSKALEKKTGDLFSKYFPEKSIYKNIQWSDRTGNGENDLTILCEDLALIIEVKSGKVTPPAFRGSPQKMQRHLQDLIIDSSKQANEFESFLKRDRKEHKLISTEGAECLIDSRKIKRFIKLGITQEFLGVASSNLLLLENSELNKNKIKLNPTLSIYDLENVLALIRAPEQILHYFYTRKRLEEKYSYTATELDLLAIYLNCRLNFSLVKDGSYFFYGCSLRIASHIAQVHEHNKQPNLKPPTTGLWSNIENQVIRRKSPMWLYILHMLMDVPIEKQQNTEKLINSCLEDWNNKIFSIPEQVPIIHQTVENRYRSFGIYIMIFPHFSFEFRDKIIGQTIQMGMDNEEAEEFLIIYFENERYQKHNEYTGIYCSKS